ncbi:MAG: exonuclease SbcCD subunit D [Rhodothermales bacterium]|nr:exonuclease SbcCD subunit D [Rhodothermales bacterium]
MKLLHTADIHFGSNSFGRIDPESGLNTRLLDFKRSFDFMVQRAIEENIDLFLFCGDAYRTADPTPTQQRTFAECLRPLSEHGIPIVMIVGNHDHPVSFGKASALDIYPYLQGDIQVFRRAGWSTIQTKAGPLQLIALPWPIRSMLLAREAFRKKSPTEIRAYIEQVYVELLEACLQEVDPALPTVLAAHLTVQGAEMAGSEQTSLIAHEPKFTVSQLARPPIDYVALGHIHRFQDRNEGHTPPVVYCGSIECISFKEWDQPKGFVLVDIDSGPNGKSTRYAYAETPYRRFVAVSVDARDELDPTRVILDAIEAQAIDDAVVRIRYRVGEANASLVDMDRLRGALSPAYAIAAIERIVDPIERERRTVVTRESSIEDAMRQYIAQHTHLSEIQDDLLERGLALENGLALNRQNHD